MENFKLNLRGTVFQSTSQALRSFLDSQQSSCKDIVSAENEYFVDRNPLMFHSILDYYTRGYLHIPTYVCPIEALNELEFWGIPYETIPPCCYKIIHNDDLDTYKALESINSTSTVEAVVGDTNNKENKRSSLRRWLLKIYDDPFSSTCGKVWLYFLLINVLASIFIIGLNSCEGTRERREELYAAAINSTVSGTNLQMIVNTKPLLPVKIADMITNTILLIDTFIRFVISRRRLQFLLTITNILEILSGVAAIFLVHVEDHPELAKNYNVRRLLVCAGILYSMRVVRILCMARYSKAVRVMTLSLWKSCHELCLFAVTALSFSVIFGSFMYWSEFEWSSNMFRDIFTAVWWAVVTMTTVGYGDYYPTSPAGYVVGGITAMCGILFLALPMAILANKFNSYYSCESYKEKQNKLVKRDKKNRNENTEKNFNILE